jgi:hypothetical protein
MCLWIGRKRHVSYGRSSQLTNGMRAYEWNAAHCRDGGSWDLWRGTANLR